MTTKERKLLKKAIKYSARTGYELDKDMAHNNYGELVYIFNTGGRPIVLSYAEYKNIWNEVLSEMYNN